eukprot:Phypoly_transcript_16516.p1 GENE.Phypoly_transcript_16516~~Phypoly_transcript_16516.p1  ORF type:complete len:222 (+),score=41.14 Phypoly_transcript_16516:193-858(+)
MVARSIIEVTVDFVKKELEGNDASHDYWHIERVWKLAREIAKQENIEDIEVVELSALLHDIRDWKYSGSETAGSEAVREFLQSQNYPSEKLEKIIQVIEGVSFKNELNKDAKVNIFPELAVVQDADRLDAIGAIGVGRTFCYSGFKNRPMHDPQYPPRLNLTKEEYKKDSPHNTTINHFYEKLLILKDGMKTTTGRKMAQKRHEFMELYLEQFLAEWEGTR